MKAQQPAEEAKVGELPGVPVVPVAPVAAALPAVQPPAREERKELPRHSSKPQPTTQPSSSHHPVAAPRIVTIPTRGPTRH